MGRQVPKTRLSLLLENSVPFIPERLLRDAFGDVLSLHSSIPFRFLGCSQLWLYIGTPWEGYKNAHAWAPFRGSEVIGMSGSLNMENFKWTPSPPCPLPVLTQGESKERPE